MLRTKTLFPICRKNEKKFLYNLQSAIEDYCEENEILSMEALYKEFGAPNEIVVSYYSNIDRAFMINRIRFSALISRLISVILFAAITLSITFGIYKKHSTLD